MTDRTSETATRVRLVLGRAPLAAEDLLGLVPGAFVTLDRHAGDRVDVCIGGRVVARGQAVLLGGRWGVRVLHTFAAG